MPIVQAKCTNCGANLNVDNSADALICDFCGSAFIVEKAIDLFSASLSESRIPAIIERGNIALEDGEWNRASHLFEEALGINPKCSDAWLGKAIALNKCRDKEELGAKILAGTCKKDSSFQRAKEYASGDMLGWFEKTEEKSRLLHESRLHHISDFCERVAPARNRLLCANTKLMGINTDGTVSFVGISPNYPYVPLAYNVPEWNDIVSVSSSVPFIAGVKEDGTVSVSFIDDRSDLDLSEVHNWKDIVSISCGDSWIVGLKKDGTVVAAGNNEYRQCNVSEWKDIKSVLCCCFGMHSDFTIGIKTDGSVLVTGYSNDGANCVSDWKNIESIVFATDHTLGLKTDGTVVFTRHNYFTSSDVPKWNDIVSIVGSMNHTVGLKSDGRVVATGANLYGECNVSSWEDIAFITCGSDYTVGLKADGTVVATGKNYSGQCDVSSWNNIVTIGCVCVVDKVCTVGLKTDGTIVSAGDDCFDFNRWKLFNNVDSIAEECQEAKQRKKEQLENERVEKEKRHKQQAELICKKEVLEKELLNLKGFFSGKKRKEIEDQIEELERQIRDLK